MCVVFVDLGPCSFPDVNHPYGGSWQSFVNAPPRIEALTPGTTHVAIGFVDLGSLAAACEVLSDAAGSSQASSTKPLRWVGYEMSAVCVAKTLVILQMVEDSATAVDEVLQVLIRAWPRAMMFTHSGSRVAVLAWSISHAYTRRGWV